MGVTWTSDQRRVIELRDCNILVSAAAGSGKTAVLVERILSMVTDKEHPIDIDSLLVVTFTRAAAAEMKERIRNALEKALEEDPENEHLQRQSSLIHHAQITTIHGFCGYVIQNYFHLIDLDPNYRIADEGELKLLKNEVLEQVLEEAYEQADPDFLDFVECYAPGKSDKRIGELIQKLYEFAISYPFPKEWLEDCAKTYAVQTQEELEQAKWLGELHQEMLLQLRNAAAVTKYNIGLAGQSCGPNQYLPMLEADRQMLEQLLETTTYQECYQSLRECGFTALSRKKDDSTDPDLKEQVKKLRDDVKKIVLDVRDKFCRKPLEEIFEEIRYCQAPVRVLIALTERFMEHFQAEKRRKNIMDFSDLEHFALQILIKKEGTETVRSEAAKELAECFSEVMIDEYQDSNYMQEYLLEAVSRVRDGANNRFMVGDVKQSIYGFRLARPELFLQMQEAYAKEGSAGVRIDLHKNFRSRSNVLDTANYIFYQIMGKDLGQINYDETEALYTGADYPDEDISEFARTEVLLIDSKDPAFEDIRIRQQAIETEALAVAHSIRSMVGKEQVWDRSQNAYRPLLYRDCVILLRTVSVWADIFCKVLQSQGIPAYTTSKTGYFSATEVVTIMNYLRICDNPKQEIPYTAVLHSPIGKCSAEELAQIKSTYPKNKIYDACSLYAREGSDEKLRKKLERFQTQLEGFRARVIYTPIHELVTQILQETGYGRYASAMPAGQQREANLHMLIEKAVEFEKTSYRGLFNFIHYMEQIQKYEVDFGEVNIYGEAADTVRIMSIHKSKGLEFPVVYLAGLAKKFNVMDANSSILLHSRFGIATDRIDSQKRTKSSTLMKQFVRQRMVKEMLGEELRVLYVALTRAKEKLILCGYGDVGRWMEKNQLVLYDQQNHLEYGQLVNAKSHMDWILQALAGHGCMDELFENYGCRCKGRWQKETRRPQISVQVITPQEMIFDEMQQQISREDKKRLLMELGDKTKEETPLYRELQSRFAYEYPYALLAEIPVKMTVSDLKKIREEEPGEELFPEEEIVPFIPKFMKNEEIVLGGAARGTLYHKIFEHLDYVMLQQHGQDLLPELRRQIQKIMQRSQFKEDEGNIDPQDFVRFLHSDLGKRMCRAGAEGKLWREQPFVFSILSDEVQKEWTLGETILVQGIVDAFFEEDDGLVIVDYKTDKVKKHDGQDLIDKYQKQLWYYKRALEKISGKTVKEMYLYSITMGRAIRIP